jgi:hypothetical protein
MQIKSGNRYNQTLNTKYSIQNTICELRARTTEKIKILPNRIISLVIPPLSIYTISQPTT